MALAAPSRSSESPTLACSTRVVSWCGSASFSWVRTGSAPFAPDTAPRTTHPLRVLGGILSCRAVSFTFPAFAASAASPAAFSVLLYFRFLIAHSDSNLKRPLLNPNLKYRLCRALRGWGVRHVGNSCAGPRQVNLCVRSLYNCPPGGQIVLAWRNRRKESVPIAILESRSHWRDERIKSYQPGTVSHAAAREAKRTGKSDCGLFTFPQSGTVPALRCCSWNF